MPPKNPPAVTTTHPAKATMGRRFDAVFRPSGRIFYGWWIALASAGIQLIGGLFFAHSFSLYVVQLKEEFDWSNSVLSFAFALTRMESGILGPLQGWLADRFGPRSVLLAGTLMFGGGLMLFSYTNSILSYYLSVLVVALGASIGGFATLMVALVNWFNKHRAKAVASSQLGYALGGLALPAMALSMQIYGWRATAFVSGFIVLATCLPLSWMVRHRPEDIGELVDGEPPVADGTPQTGRTAQVDFTASEAIRTASFWLLSAGHGFALLAVSAALLHAIPHMNEGLGFSLVKASGIMSLVMFCQIIGQAAGGYLGDRYDKRYICIACMVGHTSALLLLAFADSVSMCIAFAVLHGISWGGRGPLMVALRADYFGTKAFGMIMGISSLVVMLGMMGGPIVGGLLSDLYGSFVYSFAIIALVSLMGAFCFYFATPPTPPARQT